MATAPQDSTKEAWLIGSVVAGLAATWHVALALATRGHTVANVGGTVRAVLHGAPLRPDGAEAPPNLVVLWAVIAVVAAIATTVLVLVARRPRHPAGTVSARAVTWPMVRDDEHRQTIGHVGRKPVCIRSEDTGLMIAPPRSGKTTRRVVGAVIDAPGACVTTSTKAEVLRLTHDARSQKGQIHVFDPEAMAGWSSTTTWDMVKGCEDPLEATERARAVVKAVPMGDGASNAAFFENAAVSVLGCYLHAAALEGRSMQDVVKWAHNVRSNDPYAILENNPSAAPGWRDELESYTRGAAGPTIQSVQMTLANALGALRTPKQLKSVMPGYHSFDVERFLDSTDTLYLVSSTSEGSAAPLTTALVATIERHARLRSQASATGRFETPLTLVLDEAPNIAPIPSLPALMTDSGGRGIIVWTITQSYAQLEARWGANGARTMLNGAAALVVLGGIKEVELLDQLSRLAGQRRVARRTDSRGHGGGSTSYSSEWEENLRVEEIRELPVGTALLWYLNQPPAMMTMLPWWQRPDAKAIKASAARLEGPVRAV